MVRPPAGNRLVAVGAGAVFEALGDDLKSTAFDQDFAAFRAKRVFGNAHLKGTVFANNISIAGTARFTYDEALGIGPIGTSTRLTRIHLVQ